MAAAIKPTGLSEATTFACAEKVKEAVTEKAVKAKSAPFLICNIMRHSIVTWVWDVIL
ncbi:hypothetical protein PANT111_190226 [Pantoea brenneri]|uniref:Uncharacterized protein n=1 Tax=Pantoea brenneri TaxID=472694 RepID=A0AAX3J6P8_9GAMM|nr:hypothetical protein PANT111_190226 [Pantoea brenneri]